MCTVIVTHKILTFILINIIMNAKSSFINCKNILIQYFIHVNVAKVRNVFVKYKPTKFTFVKLII